MTPFEQRHRTLRTATGGAPWTDQAALHAADRAEEALNDFDARTGPLVDDLVEAVREMYADLRENWGCQAPTDDEELLPESAVAVGKRLHALDEASRDG